MTDNNSFIGENISAAQKISALNSGSLGLKLAENEAEIIEAQQLRYRIFFGEMGGRPSPAVAASQRDFDEYDPICDHLLVKDLEQNKIIGTYRLLRQEIAEKSGKGFYTQGD
jgi:putative hemolysin